jgi:hypothetical protein
VAEVKQQLAELQTQVDEVKQQLEAAAAHDAAAEEMPLQPPSPAPASGEERLQEGEPPAEPPAAVQENDMAAEEQNGVAAWEQQNGAPPPPAPAAAEDEQPSAAPAPAPARTRAATPVPAVAVPTAARASGPGSAKAKPSPRRTLSVTVIEQSAVPRRSPSAAATEPSPVRKPRFTPPPLKPVRLVFLDRLRPQTVPWAIADWPCAAELAPPIVGLMQVACVCSGLRSC